VEGPSGPGWIIELHGHHYYNDQKTTPPRAIGLVHVRQTLVRNLLEGSVNLPEGEFSMKELGIGYPIFVLNGRLQATSIENPYFVEETGEAGGASQFGGSKTKEKKKDKKAKAVEMVESWPAVRYDFIIQFVWQEKPLSVRLEARRKADEEAAKAKGETLPPVNTPEAPVTLPDEAIKPEPPSEPGTETMPEAGTEPEPEAGTEPVPEPAEPTEPEEAAAPAEKGTN